MNSRPSPLAHTLAPLLHYWKEQVLPLRDWDIKVAVRRGYEMEGDHGRVDITEAKRCAFIRLLDPRDANPDEMQPYDAETALVHELLHCALAPYCRTGRTELEDLAQEQAVHALSVALVAQRRRFEGKRVKQPRPLAPVPESAYPPGATPLPLEEAA